MIITGIYKIQSANKPDRIYIGSSINIFKRWANHIKCLKKGDHHCSKLQNHFNKYGESDLSFSILFGCDKEDLIKTEQYFIDTYNPYFNECRIAGSSLGIKRTDEYRRKRSIAMIGNKNGFGHIQSPEIKAKAQTNRKRIPLSEEHKRKISKSLLGKKNFLNKKHSVETKQKMRENALRNGRKPPDPTGNKHNLGRKYSIEDRKRMSISQKLRRLKERV